MTSETCKQIKTQGGFEQLELKRETARVNGLMAESLEKLFSAQGLDQNLDFRVIKVEGGLEIALGYLEKESEGTITTQGEDLTPSARAYFCRYCDHWVKGSPHSEKDDSSESTAYNLFCTICESPIGRFTGKSS